MLQPEYKVRDLIIDDQYDIIHVEETIETAAQKMKKAAVPDLVVIDNENKVVGVIADFDIVQHIVAPGKNPKQEKVKAAMYTIPPVSLETNVKEAFEIMRSLNANVIPVVEKNLLKGVVSIQDCWGYIPAEVDDEVGFIPVDNPKQAEFWLTSVCAILAFLLGVILPLSGVYGYFQTDLSNLADYLGLANIPLRGGVVNFYMFELHGENLYLPYLRLSTLVSSQWGIILACSIFTLILNAIGLFSLFYSSFSDLRGMRTNIMVNYIFPILAAIFLILQWILIAIALQGVVKNIDAIGLTATIISVILIMVGINRNYFFRQQSKGKRSN